MTANYNNTTEDMLKLVRSMFPVLPKNRVEVFAHMLSEAFDQGFDEAFEIGCVAVDATYKKALETPLEGRDE